MSSISKIKFIQRRDACHFGTGHARKLRNGSHAKFLLDYLSKLDLESHYCEWSYRVSLSEFRWYLFIIEFKLNPLSLSIR